MMADRVWLSSYPEGVPAEIDLSLIHISEPTRRS